MTNESKVVRYYVGNKGRLFGVYNVMASVPDVDYVTHADYKALEERYEIASRREQEAWSRMDKAEAELASLRERVGEQ